MSLPYPVGLPFANATLLSRQGMRPRRSHWHHGTDWAVVHDGHSEFGTFGGPIAYGIVKEVDLAGSVRSSGYGNGILVDHGSSTYSWYAHLDAIYVEAGDEVYPGDHIYDVGVSFGTPHDPTRTLAVPHLHLELVRSGWPFAASNVAARYDVLHELALVGIGLVGEQLVAGLEPFTYDEQGLTRDVMTAKSWSAAGDGLDWSTWPVWLGFGGAVLVGGAIALAPRSREHDVLRRHR